MSEPAVELLRAMAGRVDDNVLGHLRGLLAAGELGMMETELLVALTRTPVLPEELPLLRVVRDHPGTPPPKDLLIADAGTVLPRYDFTAAAPDPADQAAVDGVFGIEDVRTIRKTLRTPANHTAIPHPTLIWTIELVAGADVTRWRRYLPDLSAFRGSTCEIVAEDETLPPYQAAALTAGLVIWAAKP